MEDLCLIGFGVHPALSHVLNLHLQDNVVSRSKFEALEKRLLEIDKIAKEAKKLADKKAALARTGRGNGVQGGGGGSNNAMNRGGGSGGQAANTASN